MNEPIKDFLGHELSIGDRCVFLKNERTGRKILHVGEITGIAKSTITFQDVITLNGKIKVLNSNDIVKLSDPKTEFVPVEVVHGEWERQKGGFFFLCSACGKAAATKGNFCHNCGAKMDIG